MKNHIETETRMYWRLCQEVAIAKTCNADREVIDNLADELDVLRDYSSSQLLRPLISKMLVELVPEQQAS